LTYNGTTWTTLSLSSGSVIATWSSTFGIGAYTIGATYNGDSNNTTATGSGTVTVNKTSPEVSLSSSVNPLIYGGLSVFTATINGGKSPSGTVTFQVNGQTFGTATVSSGVAIYNGTNELWAAGTDTISAIYSGDGDNGGATGTLAETINKATPTISWATPAAITYGTALSVTQLDATSGGVAGSFAFTPAAGTVLGVGSQTLSVTFTPSDTTDYNTATGTTTLQVAKSSVLIDSTSSLNSSVYGDSVTWTFTFVGGCTTPTGTTKIKDGTVTLATVGLNAGIATYNTSALVAGNHALTAVYNGDNNYQ
jgi:hypothetical protein